MNRKEIINTLNENFRTIYITSICSSIFWIVMSVLSYRYIVEGRPTTIDQEKQMMAGFYKRDVKIKMDSISNALMIRTLQSQLIKKQMVIDSLGEVLTAERSNRLDYSEYESDKLMMFMNLMKTMKNDCGERHKVIHYYDCETTKL